MMLFILYLLPLAINLIIVMWSIFISKLPSVFEADADKFVLTVFSVIPVLNWVCVVLITPNIVKLPSILRSKK